MGVVLKKYVGNPILLHLGAVVTTMRLLGFHEWLAQTVGSHYHLQKTLGNPVLGVPRWLVF